jgi:LacI family transcriptional regulator
MPTIRDVARAAKVSETTVSLSLRDGTRISDATRHKVLSAAKRLGYVPDLAARALRLGDSRTIALLITDITDPFYARIAREVERTAQEFAYQVLIAESQWDGARELEQIERMIQARVRGFVACFCETQAHSWELLKNRQIPHVAIDTAPNGYRGSFVRNDLAEIGRAHV